MTFDPQGHITSTDAAHSGPVRVTADPAQPDYVTENAALKSEITDPLVAYKANLAANVIGTSDVLLDGGNPNPIRQKESNLGDLVADGFLAGVNRTAVADGRPLAKVAFSNGGGIRTSIAAGNITEKSTFDVLPFDNVLVTVPNVTPARFKELMEWGVAALPGANGKFPQISGYKITVDTTKQAQLQNADHDHHAGPAHHVADARRRHEDRRERRGGRRGAERQPRHDELHGHTTATTTRSTGCRSSPRACRTSSRSTTSSSTTWPATSRRPRTRSAARAASSSRRRTAQARAPRARLRAVPDSLESIERAQRRFRETQVR